MSEPVGGFIDNQIVSFIEPRLEPDVLRTSLGNVTLPDFIDRATLANELSAALKSLLHQKVGMGAVDDCYGDPDEALDEPKPESRRIVRKRLRRHLQRSKGLSREEARARVATLTDAQLDQAIGPIPVEGIGDWLSVVWAWIKNNWPTILKVLLSLLVFLGPNPENEMSHENVAAEFLASMPKSGEVQGEMPTTAQMGSLLSDLFSKVDLKDLFAKSIKIYFIIAGPGTWMEKATAIMSLFGLTPGPNIVTA